MLYEIEGEVELHVLGFNFQCVGLAFYYEQPCFKDAAISGSNSGIVFWWMGIF